MLGKMETEKSLRTQCVLFYAENVVCVLFHAKSVVKSEPDFVSSICTIVEISFKKMLKTIALCIYRKLKFS